MQGEKVATISDLLEENETTIAGLEKELKFQASKRQFSTIDDEVGRTITIMGDENIPYQLLRKILATCRLAGYTTIAFAAFQKAKGQN